LRTNGDPHTDHPTAPADAVCLICQQPPHPEVTEATIGCHYCIGQKAGERACHEAFLARVKELEGEGWQLHTMQVQTPYVPPPADAPPVFAVTFTKGFTLLVQARDREQLEEVIEETKGDLDYSSDWETGEWEGEIVQQVNAAPTYGIADGEIVHIDGAEEIIMPDPPEQLQMAEVPA